MRIRRKWRSRRRRPGSRRTVWLVILGISLIGLFQFIHYVESNMREPIMHLAKIRVKQLATESINEAITAQVADQRQADQLIEWKTDSSGKITGFMLNYSAHMRITSDTIHTVHNALDEVSKMTEHIPVGQALGSPIIASFGPKIPIKIEPKGDVKVDLKTRRQDAGINMILVEVYLRIKAELSVVVPFAMEAESVETEIPVSYLLVVGEVPMYYYDGSGNPIGENGAQAPSITLPGRLGEIPSDDGEGEVEEQGEQAGGGEEGSPIQIQSEETETQPENHEAGEP